jgi:hypothetical protein
MSVECAIMIKADRSGTPRLFEALLQTREIRTETLTKVPSRHNVATTQATVVVTTCMQQALSPLG